MTNVKSIVFVVFHSNSLLGIDKRWW